jgi:hypothetical protein
VPRTGRTVISLLIFAVFSAIAVPAPADGIHIVVIERQGPASQLVHEFIDSGLVKSISTPDGEGSYLLSPSVRLAGGAGDTALNLASAESQPLLVFDSDYVGPLEERILAVRQAQEAQELKMEVRRQVLGGLFAIPFWPYLAASEVPFKGLDIRRLQRLPYTREPVFPVSLYGATGDFRSWRVAEIDGRNAVLQESEAPGAGTGIKLDYFINSDLSGATIRLSGKAGVSLLYTEDGRAWDLSGGPSESVPFSDLIDCLEGGSESEGRGVKVSTDWIRDSEGEVGRYVAALSGERGGEGVFWADGGASEAGPVETTGGNSVMLWLILALWLLFALAVVTGNWLYGFSDVSILELLRKSLIMYPIFMVASFLLAGFWGLGFIPAAAVCARSLGREGRMLRAFWVILASCFAVAMVSLLISRA